MWNNLHQSIHPPTALSLNSVEGRPESCPNWSLRHLRMCVCLSQIGQTGNCCLKKRRGFLAPPQCGSAWTGTSEVDMKHHSLWWDFGWCGQLFQWSSRTRSLKIRSWSNKNMFSGMIDDQRRKIRGEVKVAGGPPQIHCFPQSVISQGLGCLT